MRTSLVGRLGVALIAATGSLCASANDQMKARQDAYRHCVMDYVKQYAVVAERPDDIALAALGACKVEKYDLVQELTKHSIEVEQAKMVDRTESDFRHMAVQVIIERRYPNPE
jgi:hypothetical protein